MNHFLKGSIGYLLLFMAPVWLAAQTLETSFTLKNGKQPEVYLFGSGEKKAPIQLLVRRKAKLKLYTLDSTLHPVRERLLSELPPEVALFPIQAMEDMGNAYRIFFERRLANEVAVITLNKASGTSFLSLIDLFPNDSPPFTLSLIGQYLNEGTFFRLYIDKTQDLLIVKQVNSKLERSTQQFSLESIPGLAKELGRERDFPVPIFKDQGGTGLETMADPQKIYVRGNSLILTHESSKSQTTLVLINHLETGLQKHYTYPTPMEARIGNKFQLNSAIYGEHLYQVSFEKEGALHLYRRTFPEGKLLATQTWVNEDSLLSDMSYQKVARYTASMSLFSNRKATKQLHKSLGLALLPADSGRHKLIIGSRSMADQRREEFIQAAFSSLLFSAWQYSYWNNATGAFFLRWYEMAALWGLKKMVGGATYYEMRSFIDPESLALVQGEVPPSPEDRMLELLYRKDQHTSASGFVTFPFKGEIYMGYWHRNTYYWMRM